MIEPIFALARENYYHERSYADYLRLVQLSGYQTCYFDEMDIHDPTRCYILSPYDPNKGGFPGARARLIWYDLEWRMNQPFPDVPGISEVWVADAWYARYTGKKYVPLGSHPGLALTYGSATVSTHYDLAMLCYYTNRRAAIVQGCTVDGQSVKGLWELELTTAPNGWGAERHVVLLASKIMLHVHQHDHVQTIAPQRFALAAVYRLPLLSETVLDRGIFKSGDFWSADYVNLPRRAKELVNNEAARRELEEALYQRLCVEHTFKHEIENAL